MATKKGDPGYSQLAGHIPKDLARQFRILCSTRELKISKGLEEAIQAWVSELDPKTVMPTALEKAPDRLVNLLQSIVDHKPPSEAEVIRLAEDVGIDSNLLIRLLECCTEKSNGTPA